MTLRAVAIAVVLSAATESALGQIPARRALQVSPPRGVLGATVVLSVRGAAQGARYRYTATMTAVGGSSSAKAATSCAQTQSIGTAPTVKWTPKSGTYHLTAYGPVGASETDTLSLTYVVLPRRVMLASSQTPGPNGLVTLVLRTDDLGPGHKYSWWGQLRGQAVATGSGTAAPPPQYRPWTTVTTGPLATYPTPIPPPSSISATVSVHRGDPCDIIAAGTMPPE